MELNTRDIEAWAQGYLERLSPKNQRNLMRKIAQTLRQANQKRMQAQTTPDGEGWEDRKQQGSKKNRNKMFKKLRQAKHLRIRFYSDTLSIGWAGRAGKIAHTHHYGLQEQFKNGTVVAYSQRELIGITEADKALILDTILNFIEK